MNKSLKFLITISIFIPLIFLYFFNNWDFESKSTKLKLKPKPVQRTAIDTPACQIPLLDPMHISVASMINSDPPLKCKQDHPSPIVPGTNVHSPSLQFSNEHLKKYGTNLTCHYKSLYRFHEQETIESKNSTLIEEEHINVASEFIKVQCLDAKDKSIFLDYFPFIQKIPWVENRCKNISQNLNRKAKDGRLSVLLVGLDSASRNQYMRHMKKTEAYIQSELSFVEMKGYNRVGKDTFSNMVAMLSGHLQKEVPDMSKNYTDVLPLVWHEFARAGYRTLYSEDQPYGTMFNYARKGFNIQPTDYYLRPYSLAVENSPIIKKGKRGCFNGRLETEVILKYTEDFFDVFPDDPLFALTFFTRLSHDYINELSKQDEPVQQFLQRLKEKGHLNRTVVILFGDHGFRFGTIRMTYVGRLETNFPFIRIIFPPWFPKKYPSLYENLQVNTQRLVTGFDIHATLQHIASVKFPNYAGPSQPTGRNVSIFGAQISKNRTCEDSNISDQFCGCVRMQKVAPDDKHADEAAKRLLVAVNEITSKHRELCAEFRLQVVLNARLHLVHLGESYSTNPSSSYRVTFQVNPGGGIFEGTVWYLTEKNSYTTQPEIERVNLYGNQSICIAIAALKPFCFCKDNR